MGLLDKIWETLAGKGEQPSAQPPARLLKESSEEGPYKDHDKIRERVKKFIDDNTKGRWTFEKQWFGCILYYTGNQWIAWDPRNRRYRERKLQKWIPKPVTNRFTSTLDSVMAAIQSFKVLPSVWPATNDTEDIATASVAERVVPIIEDEIDIQEVRRTAVSWMVLNGNTFLLPYYDTADTSLGHAQLPMAQCLACQQVVEPIYVDLGMCPFCGTPGQFQEAMGVDGQPETKKVPIGRIRCATYSPLETYLALDIFEWRQHRKFSTMRFYSLETIKETWPENGSKVQPDRGAFTKTAQYFMETLANVTDAEGGYYQGRTYNDRATIITHVEMPSEEYPEGLAVTMAGDETILEVGPTPFYDLVRGDKQHYFPLVRMSYRDVPGRLYGRTPAYDLVYKQDQLNRLESLIEMGIMKSTYNTWLLPAGSSISRLVGEPSQIVRWTPTGTNGARPDIVQTQPVPASLLEWRKQLIEDFEELGGTFDAMKGNVPPGVSAGYAIQMLTERAYGRFAPVFESWEAGWVGVYERCIKLARVYWTEERLKRLKGASGQWEVERFKGSDLSGAVDIRVEGGAARPRSKIAEQALVETLAKLGVIQPQDPQQRYELAELFGMSHVLGGIGDDQREAAREWDEFQKWEPPPVQQDPQSGMFMLPKDSGGPVVRNVVDNHLVHIMRHQRDAKTDVFRAMPLKKQLIWEQHIMGHIQAMQPPPGPPGPPGPQLKPAGSKAHEVGDPTMRQVREGGNMTMGAGGKNA